ncbi:MAG: SprT family zinc-dependent metalloprotease [Novosphingobium sp.]
MLDWLKRDPRDTPQIELADRTLPVVIRRLANARRLTLRLSPDGSEARVTMPRWGRTAEALAFARARADWLERQVAALPQVVAPSGGGSLAYRGKRLAIEHSPAGPRRVRLTDTAIVLGGPAETLGPRLRRWLTVEARRLLADDLAHYCARAALPVPKLALSNARRRWGSCSAKGAVRINWRLVMAPDFVRRSVVAHEVAHLVHFDHSARFHALLGELFEQDIAEANRWIKREGRGLYGMFG